MAGPGNDLRERAVTPHAIRPEAPLPETATDSPPGTPETVPTRRPLALIAGWTCAGKTRFARALAERLSPANAVVLAQDDYYRDTSHLTHARKVRVNHDDPESLDLPLFWRHLAALAAGAAVPRFRYDFASGARRTAGTLGPAEFVIGEGVRVFRGGPLTEAATLRVLLRGAPERLLERRLRRDTAARGYTEAETRRRFEEMALPAQRRALAGAEAAADLVFGMDWGDAEVAAAAARLAGEAGEPSARPAEPTPPTDPPADPPTDSTADPHSDSPTRTEGTPA